MAIVVLLIQHINEKPNIKNVKLILDNCHFCLPSLSSKLKCFTRRYRRKPLKPPLKDTESEESDEDSDSEDDDQESEEEDDVTSTPRSTRSRDSRTDSGYSQA